MEKYSTSSFEQTQKIGQQFASDILAKGPQLSAVVLALQGDLGAGKTTFLQGFAKGLGVDEVVNSPTFVIMKKFQISAAAPAGAAAETFKYFYHVDLYRLETQQDLEFLHFQEIISNPENIIAIEWPEKVAKLFPKDSISIRFNHLEENQRQIIID